MTRHMEAQECRAVSPVIGVILMVAITVILAAVIGAFVLEIGDQQETAPNTSFDSEQSTKFYQSGCNPTCSNTRNLTTVEIAHAGGGVLDTSQIEVKINGNSSVYGSTTNPDKKWNLNYPNHWPVPNFVPNLGTNDPAQFKSGESWSMHSVSPTQAPRAMSHETYKTAMEDGGCGDVGMFFHQNGPMFHDGAFGGSCPIRADHRFMNVLDSGAEINTVWSAESGGKTQTLFKYTVQ